MAGYSEIGRRPEKSNFSLACNLLSQYIKEKGCPAELSFGSLTCVPDSPVLGKPEASYRPPTTMSLLPGVDVLGKNVVVKDGASVPKATRSVELFPPLAGSAPPSIKSEKAQLTIFYAGKVLVFDNFPAEKADDLMLLASKGSKPISSAQNISFAPLTAATDHPICPPPANPPASFSPPTQPKFCDLPIARKASLHRFLEKRKDRINSKTPYKLSSNQGSKDVVSPKAETTQPWLGLGPQSLNPS